MENPFLSTKYINFFRSMSMSDDVLFNKDRVIADHDDVREEAINMKASNIPTFVTNSTSLICDEAATSSAPLSALLEITLTELEYGKKHAGRIVYGELCAVPYKLAAVFTVLEDRSGAATRLLIYNAVPSTASDDMLRCRFPNGMKVAIKEPYCKMCTDGKPAIRVDNPADILVIQENSQACCNTPADLEELRSSANNLFSQERWTEAIDKYSSCISRGLVELAAKDKEGAEIVGLQRALLLTYSNRSEAWLRVAMYQNALEDAEKALELDANHVESVLRKGKALYGMRCYGEACDAFIKVREHNSCKAYWSSKTCLEQSQRGSYYLSEYYIKGCQGSLEFCSDYIGPVKLRRVQYGMGRRGLFATRSVQPGQLLLVSNPLAVVDSDPDKMGLALHFRFTKLGVDLIRSRDQDDLTVELVRQAMASKKCMAQMYSLSSDDKEIMDIPEMELFIPRSKWTPSNRQAEELHLDIGRIKRIVKYNAFGHCDCDDPVFPRVRNGKRPGVTGLWLLPSFINHSCVANAVKTTVGNAMFVRAARAIRRGEELTLPYFNVLQNHHRRQEISQEWNFSCQCPRCMFEKIFEGPLSEISRELPSPNEETIEIAGWKLMQCADAVDEFITKYKITDTRQAGWVRASFMSCYMVRGLRIQPDKQKIETNKPILDSLLWVSIDIFVVQNATMLLEKLPLCHEAYNKVLGYVRRLYNIYFGYVSWRIFYFLLEWLEEEGKLLNEEDYSPNYVRTYVYL